MPETAFETALSGVLSVDPDIRDAEGSERATGPEIRVQDLAPEIVRLMHRICGPRAARQIRIAMLAKSGYWLTTRQVMARYGVSLAQAKRDLAYVRQLKLLGQL